MTAKTRFRGSFTALVTPFKNGAVDENGYRELIEWQIGQGIFGLVPVGTTGESPTLSTKEHKRVIEIAVDGEPPRIAVVADDLIWSTRLVNAALIAKIHTVEWTPALMNCAAGSIRFRNRRAV